MGSWNDDRRESDGGGPEGACPAVRTTARAKCVPPAITNTHSYILHQAGNVWEWTADTFNAYPGFVVDPYQEYSEPSFGSKKVLRGGSWATRSLLIRNTWRNFYMPFRNNIYAGFRTCAVR